MFVLKRIDDGAYVAVPGAVKSYTMRLEEAKVFGSWQEAERNRCIENEYIVPLSDVFLSLSA